MKYSYVSFDDIVYDVKQATGISNIRNFYTDIRNLFVRAEQEINPYAGFLIRKKMLFKKGNGNFDGKKIKKPNDFISLISVGTCDDKICECKLIQTLQYIQLCCQYDSDEIILFYYAIQKDALGNPITTVNHREAVVAFITMHLYKPKIFTGNGSRAIYKDYENDWEDRLHEARGEDFMPSEEDIKQMKFISNLTSLQKNALKQDYCIYYDCVDFEEIVDFSSDKSYWWQYNSLTEKITDVKLITDEFLSEQNEIDNNLLFSGTTYNFPYVGRYCFAIKTNTPDKINSFDILNTSTDNIYLKFYDTDRNILFLCTKEFVTNGSIFLKFTNE